MKFQDHFDRLVIAFLLLVFLCILAVFHRENFETTFLEQSASLTLGCLLGLVKGSSPAASTKEDK